MLSVSYPWPMLSLSFVSLQHCPYRTGLFNCSVQSKGLGYASLGAYVFQNNVVRMISGLRLYQRRLAGRCCPNKPLVLCHVSDETSRSLTSIYNIFLYILFYPLSFCCTTSFKIIQQLIHIAELALPLLKFFFSFTWNAITPVTETVCRYTTEFPIPEHILILKFSVI